MEDKDVLKCVRSAENLKLYETIFHLQTDSCSTDKITPSSVCCELERKQRRSFKTKNSHPVYNKVPRAGFKTVESKSGRFTNTKKNEKE